MKKQYLKNRKSLSGGLLTICIMAFNILTVQNITAQVNVPDGTDFQFYVEDNKAGFKDAEGNIVTPARYNDLKGFNEGYAAVNTGAEIKNVKVVDAVIFEGIGTVPAQYADRLIGGKWGFVDATGKEIVPCRYEYVKDFHHGVAAVNMGGRTEYRGNVLDVSGGKWGFVDATGKEIASCKYDEVKEFSEGLAAVCEKGKWGFIDENANTVVPYIYDEAGSFIDDHAWVRQKKLYGYIDKKGNQVILPKYQTAKDFCEELALVSLKGKYGFINKDGNEVIPCKYNYAESFSEGLAVVNIGGKWRNIGDYDGFSGGKWGFINTKGDIVIPLQYEHADPFKNGYAPVIEKGGTPGVISKPGM
jgi:hypothetical protein